MALIIDDVNPCLLSLEGDEKPSSSFRDLLHTRVPSLFKSFQPPWWLQNGDAQTIYSTAVHGRRKPKVQYERKYIIVPDGGCISIDITPTSGPPDLPVVIVLHGLLGGSHVVYVQSAVFLLTRPPEQGGLGYRAMVFNLRGCAGTPILSPLLYHPGMTDDLRSVILYATYLYPKSKLFCLGFSLGAGYMTNYLGEQGHDTPVIAGMGISNVWDYFVCSTELSTGRLINKILYDPLLGKGHQTIISKNRLAFQSHPRLKNVLGNRSITMSWITDEFMAPLSGVEPIQFLNDTSCSKSIEHIRRPVLYLNTKDDPLFPSKYLPIQQVKNNSHVSMFVTDRGGHLSWLENERDEYGELKFWYPSIVVEYFRAMSNVTVQNHALPCMTLPDESGLVRQKGRPNVGFREASPMEVSHLVNLLSVRHTGLESAGASSNRPKSQLAEFIKFASNQLMSRVRFAP